MLYPATQTRIVRVLDKIGADMVEEQGQLALDYLTRLDDTDGMAGGFYTEYDLPDFPDTFLMAMSRGGEIGLYVRFPTPHPKAKKYSTVLFLTHLLPHGNGLVMEVCNANLLGQVMSNAVCHYPAISDLVAVIVGYLMIGDEPKELTKEDNLFLDSLFFWPKWNAMAMDMIYGTHEEAPDKVTEKLISNLYGDMEHKQRAGATVDLSGVLTLEYGPLSFSPSLYVDMTKDENGDPYHPVVRNGGYLPEPYREFYEACFMNNADNICYL